MRSRNVPRGKELLFETYRLCRLYRCRPSELDSEEAVVLKAHLVILHEEQLEEEREMKRKK